MHAQNYKSAIYLAGNTAADFFVTAQGRLSRPFESLDEVRKVIIRIKQPNRPTQVLELPTGQVYQAVSGGGAGWHYEPTLETPTRIATTGSDNMLSFKDAMKVLAQRLAKKR